jgi:hypothetical protein
VIALFIMYYNYFRIMFSFYIFSSLRATTLYKYIFPVFFTQSVQSRWSICIYWINSKWVSLKLLI